MVVRARVGIQTHSTPSLRSVAQGRLGPTQQTKSRFLNFGRNDRWKTDLALVDGVICGYRLLVTLGCCCQQPERRRSWADGGIWRGSQQIQMLVLSATGDEVTHARSLRALVRTRAFGMTRCVVLLWLSAECFTRCCTRCRQRRFGWRSCAHRTCRRCPALRVWRWCCRRTARPASPADR